MIIPIEMTVLTCDNVFKESGQHCQNRVVIKSTNLSRARVREIARVDYRWYIDNWENCRCPECPKE